MPAAMRSRLPVLLTLPLLACPSKPSEPVNPPDTTVASEPDPDPTTEGEAAGSDEFAIPRFRRTNLGESGLSAYLPPDFPPFSVAPSEDGSDVYTSELEQGGFVYGCIAVRFAGPLEGTPEDLEGLLIAYLDFLQSQLGVTGAVGYGRGHTLEGEADVRGVIDYWEDAQGTKYAVKGWVNGTHLAVLYIAGPSEYPVFNAQQMYLDGIRFSPAP
jgi:hypothetical protein